MKIEEAFKQLKKDLAKRKLTKKEKFEDFVYDIGSWICEARISSGLTQEKLAKKIGTKQTAIARWENGSQLPSLTSIYKIGVATKLKFPEIKF